MVTTIELIIYDLRPYETNWSCTLETRAMPRLGETLVLGRKHTRFRVEKVLIPVRPCQDHVPPGEQASFDTLKVVASCIDMNSTIEDVVAEFGFKEVRVEDKFW